MHVAGKSFERVMKLGEVAGQSVACGDGQIIISLPQDVSTGHHSILLDMIVLVKCQEAES